MQMQQQRCAVRVTGEQDECGHDATAQVYDGYWNEDVPACDHHAEAVKRNPGRNDYQPIPPEQS